MTFHHGILPLMIGVSLLRMRPLRHTVRSLLKVVLRIHSVLHLTFIVNLKDLMLILLSIQDYLVQVRIIRYQPIMVTDSSVQWVILVSRLGCITSLMVELIVIQQDLVVVNYLDSVMVQSLLLYSMRVEDYLNLRVHLHMHRLQILLEKASRIFLFKVVQITSSPSTKRCGCSSSSPRHTCQGHGITASNPSSMLKVLIGVRSLRFQTPSMIVDILLVEQNMHGRLRHTEILILLMLRPQWVSSELNLMLYLVLQDLDLTLVHTELSNLDLSVLVRSLFYQFTLVKVNLMLRVHPHMHSLLPMKVLVQYSPSQVQQRQLHSYLLRKIIYSPSRVILLRQLVGNIIQLVLSLDGAVQPMHTLLLRRHLILYSEHQVLQLIDVHMDIMVLDLYLLLAVLPRELQQHTMSLPSPLEYAGLRIGD